MLIIEPCAGLGNRMIALTSAFYAAKANNHSLQVVWKEENGFACPMSRLILPPDGATFEEIKEYGFKKDVLGQLKGNSVKEKLRKSAEKYFEPDTIMNLYNTMGKKEIDRTLRMYFTVYIKATNPFYDLSDIDHPYKIIRPVPEIQEKMKWVLSTLDEQSKANVIPEPEVDPTDIVAMVAARLGKDTSKPKPEKHRVGVHIRRTDHVESIEHSPIELFVARMQAEIDRNPGTEFYLASDDTSVHVEMQKRFPGRILLFKNKSLSRDSLQGIQDAYVEMLLLGTCEKILGSYNSTFSYMASQLSGTPLEVVAK